MQDCGTFLVQLPPDATSLVPWILRDPPCGVQNFHLETEGLGQRPGSAGVFGLRPDMAGSRRPELANLQCTNDACTCFRDIRNLRLPEMTVTRAHVLWQGGDVRPDLSKSWWA